MNVFLCFSDEGSNTGQQTWLGTSLAPAHIWVRPNYMCKQEAIINAQAWINILSWHLCRCVWWIHGGIYVDMYGDIDSGISVDICGGIAGGICVDM
jgi:hypothetical protein